MLEIEVIIKKLYASERYRDVYCRFEIYDGGFLITLSLENKSTHQTDVFSFESVTSFKKWIVEESYLYVCNVETVN